MSDHYGCRCGNTHGNCNPGAMCSRCERSREEGLTWADVIERCTGGDALDVATSVDQRDYEDHYDYVEAVIRAAIEAGSEA